MRNNQDVLGLKPSSFLTFDLLRSVSLNRSLTEVVAAATATATALAPYEYKNTPYNPQIKKIKKYLSFL